MTKRRSSNDSERNWLLSLPCRHCVKPVNSASGGKASLVIGSRKSVLEAERNVLLLSRPCCRANSNRPQNVLGVPSLELHAMQYFYAHDMTIINSYKILQLMDPKQIQDHLCNVFGHSFIFLIASFIYFALHDTFPRKAGAKNGTSGGSVWMSVSL